jgi:CRP-like cAMP-binding protein
MKHPLAAHPLRNTIRLKLKSHPLLAQLDDEAAYEELFSLIEVHECSRGERLLEQGGQDLRHFFVIEGVLKRMVTSSEGREMTLHFAGEGDMETCFEAWRQHTGSGFAIVCAQRSLIASLPMDDWYAFLERHPAVRRQFHERLVLLGAAIVEHAVALLLLDAPSRVNRFSFRHPELVGRLPQKDVASHLNLSAETLCRLTRRHRGELQQQA